MTVHFAAARSPAACSPVARALARRTPTRNANDNGTDADQARTADDQHLEQALRHFALHGMAAAGEAVQKALAALQRGEISEYRRWSGICGKLDRRAAAQLAGFAALHENE